MLRKTAAIAVLILIVTSFTLGSTVRVQTAAAAGVGEDAVGHFPGEGYRTGLPSRAAFADSGFIQKTAGAVRMGLVENMPGGDADFPPAVAFVSMVGGQITSGIVREGMMLQAPDENYSSLVIYMDEMQVLWPAFQKFAFAGPDNRTQAGTMYSLPVRLPDWPDSDNLTIKGKMAMVKPGADTEFYDFYWTRAHTAGPGESGDFAHFSGHMTLPESGGDSGKMLSFGTVYRSGAGTVEISSDMTVDLAELRAAVAAGQANDTYDNNIAAGETNWHAASVGDAVESVNVDLKWADPGGNLRLMIYTPDGKVLGPYYDDADGKDDARINLNVANPSGVASGEWHLKVTDMATLGNNDYYVRTY
jgi:hypothetical protein